MLRVQGGLLGCQCSHTQGNVRSTANSLVFMLFTKVCFASLEVPIPKRTCSAAGLLPLAQSVRGPRYSTAHGSRSPCVHRCAVFLGNQVVFVEQHSTPAIELSRQIITTQGEGNPLKCWSHPCKLRMRSSPPKIRFLPARGSNGIGGTEQALFPPRTS